MKFEFPDIIDREKGKTAIVVGLGPSLKAHQERIKQLANDPNKFVVIGCNDIDSITNINFHYWVFANSMATIKKMYDRMNARSGKSIVVYADSVDLTPRNDVESLLKVDYMAYDQRHFDGNKCNYNLCCKHIIPGRMTIQEEFKKYTKYHTYTTSCDTVVIHMLYLAVLVGCKNIYITGVDLDYSKGYVNDQKSASHVIEEMKFTRSRILDSIAVIRDSAKNIDVNIYCLDKSLSISSVLEYAELPQEG